MISGDEFSQTAQIIERMGLDNLSCWGIMLTNLAYTPQINWFVTRLNVNEVSSKEYVTTMLVESGTNERAANDIFRSMVRFVGLPFNTIGLGYAVLEKSKAVAITRTPWQSPDPLVILYSLYKFAEACGDYYQFTLNRLLAHAIDSDGVSPTEIFGLDRDQMEKLLNGLSVNHPDFITASFTLDLDSITLNADKTSQDVLSLF